MKRAPIVLAGTVAGLAGVLAYHPASHASSLAASSAATASTPASTGAASTTATTKTTTATTTTAAKTSTAADTSTAAKTGTAATTRSATGEDVQFQYGDIQIKVTVSGTKVTHVSIVSLNETDPHSQEIDAQAVPVLEQQTLSAGSAQIDGVSGASYTSQAYDRSLQSALDKLGITGSAA